ncbi:MAG: hypothetical protein ACI4SC_01830 [Candidatus Neoclostridium sp.]
MKVKLFISDKSDESGSLWGVWRELGKLKNNSELVALIDDNEHRVMIDNYSFECVEIVPAGEEDVVLCVKCVLSLSLGNPIVFYKE